MKRAMKRVINQSNRRNPREQDAHIEMEITIALTQLQGKNNDKKKKCRKWTPIKETEIKEKATKDAEGKYTHDLSEDYRIRVQLSFYRRTDYDQLYAHMGAARLPKSHFISFYTTEEKNPVAVEQYSGEMSGLEAESIVRRIIYMQLFGTTDDISIEERERFVHWRHFNKEMRRFYEATASVRYKPMHMALKMPVLAR